MNMNKKNKARNAKIIEGVAMKSIAGLPIYVLLKTIFKSHKIRQLPNVELLEDKPKPNNQSKWRKKNATRKT